MTTFLARPVAAACAAAFIALPALTAQAQDPDDGARVFRRCVACHTTEEGGASKAGPNLFGIFGAVSGSRDVGFNFSPALREAAVVWDDDTLDQWLADPRGFIKGSRMPLGVAKPDQRADLIAYLKQVTQ